MHGNNPMTTAQEPPSTDWLQFMVRQRRPVGYSLFGLGAAAGVVALILLMRTSTEWLPEILGLTLFGLTAVTSGALYLFIDPRPGQENDYARMLVLADCAVLGFFQTVAVIWRRGQRG